MVKTVQAFGLFIWSNFPSYMHDPSSLQPGLIYHIPEHFDTVRAEGWPNQAPRKER